MDLILITHETIGAAALHLRSGRDDDHGAAILLELTWAGAARRQLASLTRDAISWPAAATLRAVPRPAIVLRLPSKNPCQGPMPVRPSPVAAAWIARRAKTAPATGRLFGEAMFRAGMRALRAEVGEKVLWSDLRRSAAFQILHAAEEAIGDAIEAVGA